MARHMFGMRRSAAGTALRWVGGIVGLVLLLLAVAVAGVWLHMRSSLPRLEGELPLAGLPAPVTVERDAQGVPTLTSTDRVALAQALGYLHGQERFFQMDTLRRAAAGELGLLRPAAAGLDKTTRPHRFRQRAQAMVERATPEDRRMFKAYADGVNAGLADLGAAPVEYLPLQRDPQPWTEADSLLVLVAMYFNLQDSAGWDERRLSLAIEKLGPDLAAFLYPPGTDWDAPLDGTRLPEPAPPAENAVPARPRKAALAPPQEEPAAAVGSNNWAVGGHLAGGPAMLADDMHLGISVPNTWYRARLVLKAADGSTSMDITGVTLPGEPNIVVGSNGRIAWGFTNGYIDTGDLVVLEPVDGDATRYMTPEGPKTLARFEEKLCPGEGCETLVVEESVWGPVVGTDSMGRKLAYRWIAHDIRPDVMSVFMALETAGSVDEAVAIAHNASIPNQNLVVVDAQGNLAWTIIGQVPRRVGFDGTLPTSWADGARGWQGMLPPEEVPVVKNPDDGRLWTANARVVGGEALAKLGDGGYALGARAKQIREGLLARDAFTEKDLLAIQLDDRGLVLEFWQARLEELLKAKLGQDPELAAMLPRVETWGGRATVDSVGYRLVRAFRTGFVERIYRGWGGGMAEAAGLTGSRRLIAEQSEQPARRLIIERPAHLVPPGFDSWDALVDDVLAEMKKGVREAGGLDAYSWGRRNVAGVKHPLTLGVPQLGELLNPPEAPQPGDTLQPRVAAPGFGASQRLVVAPGREAQGIFHMPTGQSGHPFSTYYMAGHQDWLDGRPTPFLPGETKWRLELRPGS
ncbi:MAG TPA: penicillin acylase family protein [Azospirillaceae bacterium]|nr:penicillin acylase family protein [Azospirillaceae bacterium]